MRCCIGSSVAASPFNPIEALSQPLDWLVMRDTRDFDHTARQATLDALRADLTAGLTHLLEHEIDDFLTRSNLTAPMGSAERAVLAKQIIRANIAALERTLAREQGRSDRIADAIQSHAGRTASDDYGDVSLIAKARVIDALPDYDL